MFWSPWVLMKWALSCILSSNSSSQMSHCQAAWSWGWQDSLKIKKLAQLVQAHTNMFPIILVLTKLEAYFHFPTLRINFEVQAIYWTGCWHGTHSPVNFKLIRRKKSFFAIQTSEQGILRWGLGYCLSLRLASNLGDGWSDSQTNKQNF